MAELDAYSRDDREWTADALYKIKLNGGLSLDAGLEWYAWMYGMRFTLPKTPGQALREKAFNGIVQDAVLRLPPDDRQWLRNVPILFSDTVRQTGKTTTATATLSLDPITGSYSIILYRCVIMYDRQHDREYLVDWVRRLLLHEIGHARGRSDDEMAATDNY